jgi:methylmalonyl-CoA/ethylmalonyl-CoA epimerase
MTMVSDGGPGTLGTLPDHPIAHIGYVVPDLRQTIEIWGKTFGAGPFFLLEDVSFDELEHSSGPVTFEHSTAFGMCGDTALEFWEIHKIEPASVVGPRFAPDCGMNHLAYYVDDVPAESKRLEDEAGFPLLLRGIVGPMELRIHDAPELGHMIEIQPEADFVRAFQREISAAAKDWDGSDPVRSARDILHGF